MYVKNIFAKRMSHKIMKSRIVHNNPFVKAGRRTGARRVPARDLRGVIRRVRKGPVRGAGKNQGSERVGKS